MTLTEVVVGYCDSGGDVDGVCVALTLVATTFSLDPVISVIVLVWVVDWLVADASVLEDCVLGSVTVGIVRPCEIDSDTELVAFVSIVVELTVIEACVLGVFTAEVVAP